MWQEQLDRLVAADGLLNRQGTGWQSGDEAEDVGGGNLPNWLFQPDPKGFRPKRRYRDLGGE